MWSISKQYLGCGTKWREITYDDGTYPEERDLTIGRTLIFDIASVESTPEVIQKEVVTAANTRVIPKPVTPPPQTHSQQTLAFNTAIYCCAMDTFVMDTSGQFVVVPQEHPFIRTAAPKQKMLPFMKDIRISQELIDAFNDD
ncbi:hypothetical protein BFV94_4589 [Alteromonas macleodii]|uniref:Uncharacterized protein n=1 Tax=Alteromonas macleodii TaxID=28108 RepID=A0AB36FKY3_ALTMA|nr:hypothetical protein BFV93_4809 [Alteromonas macleodii]OES24840.1 hypothetical protein BFV95_4599 [Alteromonas macleodii]OES25118.1 hypothetical protein BFV94_4589 [Alteromonas macleodii]OES39161.1 hypothetical protein BFV96_4309 [Alteromonas macleodii]